MRSYETLKALVSDGEIEFEGMTLKYAGDWTDLKPGDTYIAERNTGPKLLTVLSVNTAEGWVVPKEIGYSFDLGEVAKVKILID